MPQLECGCDTCICVLAPAKSLHPHPAVPSRCPTCLPYVAGASAQPPTISRARTGSDHITKTKTVHLQLTIDQIVMAKFEGAYYFADVLQIKGSKVMVYYHDDGLVATVGITDVKPTSDYHHCLSRCNCSCLFVLATTITVTSGWVPLVRSFWMMTANSGLCANQFRRKVTTCAGNKMQIRILKTISIAGMSYG